MSSKFNTSSSSTLFDPKIDRSTSTKTTGSVFTSTCLRDDGVMHRTLEVAASNIPKIDIVERVLVGQAMNLPDTPTEDELRFQLAYLNLSNPICNRCLDKSNPQALRLCKRCCLIWYCSDDCASRDATNHARRCCQPDGPSETGPMRIAVVNVRPS